MLNTSPRSIMMECSDAGLSRDIDLARYSNIQKVRNPDIATAKIIETTTCRNKKCETSFDLGAADPSFPACPHCNHVMVTEKIVRSLDCTIIITIDDTDFELKVSETVLRSVEGMAGLKKDDMMRSLLMFSGTFDVNFEKKKITAIHEDLQIFDE